MITCVCVLQCLPRQAWVILVALCMIIVCLSMLPPFLIHPCLCILSVVCGMCPPAISDVRADVCTGGWVNFRTVPSMCYLASGYSTLHMLGSQSTHALLAFEHLRLWAGLPP
jgi:hypothetical protein